MEKDKSIHSFVTDSPSLPCVRSSALQTDTDAIPKR